ncbi:hypothetical protein Trydic_g2397 [Trypoxylus dichotomus]
MSSVLKSIASHPDFLPNLFLWTLYSNDSGTYIVKNDFQKALQLEGTLPDEPGKPGQIWDRSLKSLFGEGQDKVGFDHFRARIQYDNKATVLSKWLLTSPCVSLSSELEAPTFYQTLAGVTHLVEQDICELEKCFWSLQGSTSSGQLDVACVTSLVCPPIPATACQGLFLALDVNRDGHVDFKELCCGVSAACRGPTVERMKFCFKVFDMDRDGLLNPKELQHMVDVLLYVASTSAENNINRYNSFERQSSRKSSRSSFTVKLFGSDTKSEAESDRETITNEYIYRSGVSNRSYNSEIIGEIYLKQLEQLKEHLSSNECLSQEDFLVWNSLHDGNSLVEPFLELLFQVCHVSLGLKPYCRHHEHEIVMGWLNREKRRGYRVGQFWYLISSEWWQTWLGYTTAPRNNYDNCNCRSEHRLPVEEGIVCDESFTSNGTDFTSHSNEATSNSTDSMGDLLSKGDSCSIASSSGVSSSSGTGIKRGQGGIPGPINNSSLTETPLCKVATLTGEGGRLKRDIVLRESENFELVPDSLWKALALWYGGPLPLPRQVIKPPNSNTVELELYPVNLKILRHQSQTQAGTPPTWSSVVGGYGAAALSTAGITTTTPVVSPRRYVAHTAAFSRLANIRQVIEFLSVRLALRLEDIRLWHVKDVQTLLLEDENVTLQDLGMQDNEQILLEVRNKDLTWPEELGALVSGNTTVSTLITSERRPTITLPPGATGLQNLGNTCFMNAALQAVSNTRPLTLYFQRDLSELNCTNPLGTKGQVAKRYAELCRDLWAGSTRSVAPIRLRLCVTKHAPNLGGGGQHDSQELLAWLLDSLHEDLNRVPKKQFVELRDSDGRPDAVVADEAWGQHLARDHSIITDLFYGQLKSKVTCQTCGHESVKFDPFNLLSLPLPMESYTLCEILVICLNGEVPIKYGLRLNSEAKYYELKQQLQNLCGIPPERLSLAEVASSQIKQFLDDDNKIASGSATELYAYELPKSNRQDSLSKCEEEADLEQALVQTPLARSPEVRSSSALCMPNILCFKNLRSGNCDNVINQAKLSSSSNVKKASIHSNISIATVYTDNPSKTPTYLVAVHRKFVTQETYFLSQHKSMPSLFGVPLLLGCNSTSTCQSLYKIVQQQVSRLLSPQPQSDQTNHAQDCDDSLGYEFPFSLKAVMQNGERCARCHWTQFCPGCRIPCTEVNLFDFCRCGQNIMCVAIDWDPTALHLRYQSSREKLFIEHESVGICRKLHTEPIDLDYCLRAFTSEERLETKYHCSKCQDKQPATKKLQIWRLPPILIIHLKRFDYVNNKWVKTQKVVNFPFKNFDPTAYLASVPQETILRHRQLLEKNKSDLDSSCETATLSADVTDRIVEENGDSNDVEPINAQVKLLDVEDEQPKTTNQTIQRPRPSGRRRERDFHEHKLLKGQDPFDLKYQLYAVVSHSGMLNGGHYISYACNPNGHWYCYNDSSCREVLTEDSTTIAHPAPQENNNNDSRQTNNYCSPISNRSVNSPAHTPLMRRKHPRSDSSSTLSQMSSDTGSSTVCNTSDVSIPNITSCKIRCSNTSLNMTNEPGHLNDGTDTSTDASETHNLVNSNRNSPMPIVKHSRKLSAGKAAVYDSDTSLDTIKCAYSDVKIPKIDTSSAYMLFYERSGLDYRPYLPDVVPNGQVIQEVDMDESESELRKQLCTIQ